MTPRQTNVAPTKLHTNKMSVSQLEQLVSCIVRSSCRNGADTERIESKPKKWSRDAGFSYPTRARTTDTAWREKILDVVARCTNRGKDSVRHDCKFPTRKRLKSTESVSSSTTSKERDENDNISSKNILQDKYPSTESLPVIRLCDVLKMKAKENNTVKKNDFLNYFKLSDTQYCSVIVNSNTAKYSHPLHLLNTHNVPFSSDLGRKLTKENHIVPEEIHQRKIERVERYLTTVINTDTAKPVQFEVSFNKHPQYSHTYVFPNKVYRRKDKISSKASFILINYCKPCSVKLEKLPDSTIIKYTNFLKNVPTNTIKQKSTQKTNSIKQIDIAVKENLPLPVSMNKVVENVCIREKDAVVLKVVPKTENSVLKPNNQSNVEPTTAILSPIKDLFGLSSPKIEKKKRKLKSIQKIGRVQKKKVFIYETRRSSVRVLRLKCVSKSK